MPKKGYKQSEEHKRKIGQTNSIILLGRKMPEEIKGKISKALKGRKVIWGDKISQAHKGKPKSPQHIENMSRSKKGKKSYERTNEIRRKFSDNRRGNNGSNWRGGITPENKRIRNGIEFRLWREAVFARDNWICQKYGIKGGNLHPHYIQNFSQFPELRFAIDNGITLSEKAHQEFHRKYGKINNTREQLEKFLLD